jgi:hypothetical protein
MSNFGAILGSILNQAAGTFPQALESRRQREEQSRYRDALLRIQQQQADREERHLQQAGALAKWKEMQPFFTGANSGDLQAQAVANGTFGAVVSEARDLAEKAGVQFNAEPWLRAAALHEQRAPGHIDVGNVSLQPDLGIPGAPGIRQLGPLGYAAPFLPQATPESSQFVPLTQTQQVPQAPMQVRAPARIETQRQSINPASLGPQPYQGLSLGNLLPSATPAGQVSVPRPDLSVTTPVEPTIGESIKSQIARQEAATRAANQKSMADKRRADIQKTLQQVIDIKLLRPGRLEKLTADIDAAWARGDLADAQTLLAEAKRETEDALRNPRVGLTTNQGANVGNLPASRAAGRQTQADIAAANRASREKVAGAQISSREGIAAANRALRGGAAAKLPPGASPFLSRLAGLPTAQVRDGLSTRLLTPDEQAQRASQINDQYRQAFGQPLYGPGGVLSSRAEGALSRSSTSGGTGAPAATPTPATGGVPARGYQFDTATRAKIRQGIDAGQFVKFLRSASAQDPAVRNALLREYANVVGRPWRGK